MLTTHKCLHALTSIGDNVNIFYITVNDYLKSLFKSDMHETEKPPSIHETRRNNLSLLLREFTTSRLAQGEPAKGIEAVFAEHLGISRITLSLLKSSRNISDKVAEQFEFRAAKPPRWLDARHTGTVPSPAQLKFVELCQSAWQNSDAKGRRRLMQAARHGFKDESGFNDSHPHPL